MPFSSVPTPFAIEGGGRSWFANCAWDAFGIPILVGVDAVISTTCQDCDGPIVYRVEERRLVDAHGVVHFARAGGAVVGRHRLHVTDDPVLQV